MRRRPLPFLFALFLISTTLVANSYAAPFAYISNMDSNSVSVIDMASNTVTATIPVGVHPQGLAVNPAGTRAYVANMDSNDVSVIDTGSNTVAATVAVGTSPMRLAVSPTGAKVYVSNAGSGTVSVIDAATNTVVDTITTGGEPRGIRVNPAGTKVYVANFQSSGSVQVIDTATKSVNTILVAGNSPIDLAITPDGSKVYVLNYYSNNVSVIDTASDAETATIAVGENPIGVWVNPAGTRVFVTNVTSGNVMVIDPSTNGVTVAATGFLYPVSIEGCPDGSRLYVVEQGNNRVSVLNAANYLVVTNVPVGSGPRSYNGNFIASPPSVTDGLVSFWRGEGNGFDTIGGNHGTLQGGTTFAAGKLWQAFSFAGAAYVQAPATVADFGSNPFTVAFWMYATSDPPSDAYLVGKSHPDGGLGWDIRFDNNAIKACGVNGWGFNIVSAASVALNSWHHIAVASTDSLVTLYIDGVVKGTSPRSAISSAGNPFRIGYTSNYGGSGFNGLIDDVAIYNRAISAKEVLRLVYPNGPVSWWRGENDVTDSIGNNDGTWQGTPAYGTGVFGNAFVFNGVDNQVNISDNPSLNFVPTSPMSLSFWFKRGDGSNTANLIGKRSGCGADGIQYQVAIDPINELHFNSGGQIISFNTIPPVETWNHAAVSFDGGTARLYLNGELVKTAAITLGGATSAPLEIGKSGSCTGFNGQIDDVKIYDRTLTASEVADNFGMVSWWGGDGNATDTMGLNNASLIGTPSFQSGILNGAFSFNGTSQYAVVTAPVRLPVGNEPRTVAGWIKSSGPTSGPSANGYQTVIGYGTPWTNGATFLLEWGGHINDRKLYLTGWNADLAGSTQLSYNQWYHVAATYDGTTARLYVNGVLDGELARNLNTVVNSAGLMIGNSPPNDGWHGYFKGLIDEMAVFNRALSANEIAAMYSSKADTTPDDFIFIDQTKAVPGATVTSNTITISGINQPATIEITSCTGSVCEWRNVSYPESQWRSDGGTVTAGNQIQVRQTASSSIDVTTGLTLSIGGVSDTFSLTTSDHTAPGISEFTISATESTTMAVTVNDFTVTDNVGVTGFMITSSSTPPLASDAGWSATAPTSATLTTAGDNTLYAWAKDAEGNVSDPMTDSVILKPVLRGASDYYTSLHTACGEASSGETVQALAATVPGNVTITDQALTIKGGHADRYGSQPGITTIQGTLTIGTGSLIVEKVAVR